MTCLDNKVVDLSTFEMLITSFLIYPPYKLSHIYLTIIEPQQRANFDFCKWSFQICTSFRLRQVIMYIQANLLAQLWQSRCQVEFLAC